METKKSVLDYGKWACDTMIAKYEPQDLPPKDVFFYHQGVFLSGMQGIYALTGEKKYFDYVKAYVDHVLGPNGEIIGFCHEMTRPQTPSLAKRSLQFLDCKQPALLLFQLLEETKDEKYKRALETIIESLYYWPVNEFGGYWHMMTQHNQMWLDGAYMVGPLAVTYAEKYGEDTLRDRAVHQVFLMEEHMKDEKTGLYYHGFDASKKEPWADPVTGLSGQFWGRAVGWYAVAVLDMLEHIPSAHPGVERLKRIERELLEALVKVQDPKTGMWFEVLDRGEDAANWVESSCTCLFLYSFAKAIRTGILSETYGDVLEKGCKGLFASLQTDAQGGFVMGNICCGTCIDEGTYAHYIGRPVIKNDLHGMGAFLLMCAELERYQRRRGC